jgi:hypothetical protein
LLKELQKRLKENEWLDVEQMLYLRYLRWWVHSLILLADIDDSIKKTDLWKWTEFYGQLP